MELTPERKKEIDNLSYESLLRMWRFAPIGEPWFQGETGQYLKERMNKLRSEPNGEKRHIEASKNIGW